MKRTLLAVGVAVLASMMDSLLGPIFLSESSLLHSAGCFRGHLSFFMACQNGRVEWTLFAMQTVFAGVAAAVIANLLPRRPRK